MCRPRLIIGVKIMINRFAAGVLLASLGFTASVASDGNVTNDVFFGNGNENGDFTIDQNNGIEVGLRGKLRFDGTTNKTGSTYTFDAGAFTPGTSQALWNVDYSVNMDFLGLTGDVVATHDIVMQWDLNPDSTATTFVSFNPLILGGSFGDNSTMGDGGIDGSPTDIDFGNKLVTFNIIQGSQNFGFFFNDGTTPTFDPTVAGGYDITLSVVSKDENLVFGQFGELLSPFERDRQSLATTSIRVSVQAIPEPATWLMMILGFALTAFASRRRQSLAVQA